MDNEDRIRRWRERRQADATLAAGADGYPEEAGIDWPETGEAPSPELRAPPPDIDLETMRETILQRRRDRFRTLLKRIAIFAGIPLLVILAYVGFVASRLYSAESVFTVETTSEAAPSPVAGIFAIGSAGSTIADAFKAREYMLSRPMMNYMEKQHRFVSYFGGTEMDPLTRFNSPLGLNSDPYSYYLKRVRVSVDVQEGILRLYVYARSQQDAVRFGNEIMAAAEQHVNELSQKISDDQISSLTSDVRQAEQQVQQTRQAVAAVQARRGELSPEQTATAVYQLISSLQLQLADAQRQRNSLLDQGLTNSPLLPRLNSQISELTSQIADQRRRLVNPGGGSLQRSLNDMEGANANKEIAQARYQSALNTLQQAYLKILEQRRYFVTIVGMSAGAFPRVRDGLTIAGVLLFLLAIVYGLVFALPRLRVGGFERTRLAERFAWLRNR